jgi:hypothetical protein
MTPVSSMLRRGTCVLLLLVVACTTVSLAAKVPGVEGLGDPVKGERLDS